MNNNRVSVYLNLLLFIIHIIFLFTSVYITTRLLHLRYNVFISCSNSDKFCLQLRSSETIERRTFSYVTEILKLFPVTRFTTDRLQLLKISLSNSKLKLNKFHNSHGSLGHNLLRFFIWERKANTVNSCLLLTYLLHGAESFLRS